MKSGRWKSYKVNERQVDHPHLVIIDGNGRDAIRAYEGAVVALDVVFKSDDVRLLPRLCC